MGAVCGKKIVRGVVPTRPSVDFVCERGTEPRMILSNKSPYRVSYSVIQEDKKRTTARTRKVTSSMGMRLKASITGECGASADGRRTTDLTEDTEETELCLVHDHRMEPMGQTQDTEVLFPLGCQDLRVYARFEEDGQWKVYKNKRYSIALRKKNIHITALRSNIVSYTKRPNESAEPTVALGDFSAGGCGCVKPLLDATILTMIRGGAFKTV